MLLHEVSNQFDWRPAIDLVQHAPQRGRAGFLAIDHWKVDVRLSFAASMRDIAFQLECPNHAGDARVSQLRVDAIPDFGRRCFAEVPEHTHDVQLALGQMNVLQCSLGGVVVAPKVIVTCACAWWPTIGWGIHKTKSRSDQAAAGSRNR